MKAMKAPFSKSVSTAENGWESYQAVSEKLGIAHHRIVLRGPKDLIKILPPNARPIDSRGIGMR